MSKSMYTQGKRIEIRLLREEEAKADRKTENNSEKPNNSTISKMEQVDEPQTCSVNGRPYTDCCNCEYFKCTADEPQTEAFEEPNYYDPALWE